MRFEGKLRKSGKFWLAEIPILDAITQGRTRKEALAMVCDWIETMIEQPSFRATIDRTVGDSFEIGGSDAAALVALLLRRRRQAAGVSLADIAARLGCTSRNAYARYERGDAVPSIGKLDELLKATSSSGDFVIREASPPYSSTTRKKK